MMAAFSCAKCGKPDLFAFAASYNGLLCSECVKYVADAYPLQESTVYTIQYILSSPINKLFSFSIKNDVFDELDHVIGVYFAKHISKNFKSLEILSTLS